MSARSLRVCLFATFDPRNWSGGRYHALMLAAAAARAGFETHVVADRRPAFAGELEQLCDAAWKIHESPGFWQNLPEGAFDFVILIPTGIFLPAFYEAAIGFARARSASLALVNFESANWFNEAAPARRDPRLWEYWQRACLDGALVLSSTRTSHQHAQRFYQSDGAPLRHEVWPPPVNSAACRAWDGSAKQGSVVAFVRPSDDHKGAADLLALDPSLFARRRLDIIAGTGLQNAFCDLVRSRLGGPETDIRFHARISDSDKFRLLTVAQALLFPSRFEGYGYPPVEAAYAGTEIVCNDLEVLRETVGPIAHFASPERPGALGDALGAALVAPPRVDTLRAAVAPFAAFEQSALQLGDILLRSREVVPAPRRRPFRTAWGPPAGTAPHTDPTVFADTQPVALPPSLVSVRRRGRCLLVTARISVAGSTAAVLVSGEAGTACVPVMEAAPPGEQVRTAIHFVLPDDAIGNDIKLQPVPPEGTASGRAEEHMLRIEEVAPEPRRLPTRSVITSIRRDDSSLELEGWLLSALEREDIWAVVENAPPQRIVAWSHRNGIGQHYPGYLTYRFSYALALPPGCVPERGIAIFVVAGGGLDEVLGGWPPQPVGKAGLFMPAPGGAAARPPQHARAQPFPLAILDVTDSVWHAGVARRGTPEKPGAILVARTAQAAVVRPGDQVSFPSGRACRVAGIAAQEDALVLELDLPLRPPPAGSEPGPVMIQFGLPRPDGPPLPIVACTNECWWNGVWNLRDSRYRHGILIDPAAAGAAALAPGCLVQVAQSGRRRIIDVDYAADGVRVWLNDGVAPFGDGAPGSLRLVVPTAQTPGSNGGAIFSVPDFKAKDPAYLRLAALARRDGRAGPDAGPRSADRPRILFASLVSPMPDNQGNRVVTRSYIDHLVAIGFDVDLLVQNGVDLPAIAVRWGDRVRVFMVPYPQWAESETSQVRRDLLRQAQKLNFSAAETILRQNLERAADEFHPYFIVRDETVALAKSLYRYHAYEAIICNYTHMLRVPIELAPVAKLPPVVVITHDALSRLNSRLGAVRLDTSHRACPPAIERNVLNAVKGAVVVAINDTERKYFETIGVKNKVITCEHDSAEELAYWQVPETAFDRRTLLFQGSGNPVNAAGMAWFLDLCWDAILQRVPEARLVICGSITAQLPLNIPNAVYRGDVSRTKLLEQMRDSSISINPCVAGTGLKIKTVEACGAGLPQVCLKLATEGLESVQARFAVVADDAAGFVAACVSLLTERDRWLSLRNGALDLAASRFACDVVYRHLDAALGWDAGAVERRLRPRPLPAEAQGTACGKAEREALAALGERDGWAAAVEAAAICALRPDLVSGYRLVASGLEQLMKYHDAAESLRQGLAVDPDNPALRADYFRMAAQAGAQLNAVDTHPFLTLRMALDRPQAFNADALGRKKLGWGWSSPEEWGTWTDGPAARLRLELDESFHGPCHFVMQAHAYLGVGEVKRVAVSVNGSGAGQWRLTESGRINHFALPLDGSMIRRGELVIELLIGSPRMVKQKGRVVDSRWLGLGVREIGLTSALPPGALAAAPA